MKAGVHDSATLQAVSVEELTSYLTLRGWISEPSSSPYARVWYRDGDPGAESELLVPSQESLADYATRVGEILRTLERTEKRSQVDILRDLLFTSADVIRLRRPTANPSDASIVLHDGAALVNHALGLMTAAACSTVTPRAVVPSRRPLQAIDYLRTVRMGQTELGSYVLTIVSKVAPLLTPGSPGLLEYMEEPFPRKVTRTLARSLAALQDAALEVERTGNFGVFSERITDGVSANLCDAVRGMVSREDYSADIGIILSWAAASSSPPPEGPTTFEFHPSVAPLLTEAAEYLRQSEPQEGALITGVVVGLHRPEGEWDGRVTVACVIEGSVRQLQVSLPGAEYQLAVEAHGAQKGVMFRADITRTGRFFRAANATEFRVLD